MQVAASRDCSATSGAIGFAFGSGFGPEFDFVGTRDPSAWLALDAAFSFVDEHGQDAIRAHNVLLARRAGAMLAERFGTEPLVAPRMRGALCAMTSARCAWIGPPC